MGSLVIDIGAGTTEYAVYSNGIIKHTGVIAVGGDHLSNDLAYGLKVPLGRAEQLKIDHGSALVEPEIKGHTITLTNDLGIAEKTINLEHLRRIMSLRLAEIFQLIATELDQSDLLNYVREGVFLTGGCSRIAGIQTLANQVFHLPVSIGKTNSISGLKSALDQPEFATAIGLARFGSFEMRKRSQEKPGLQTTISQTFKQIFGRA
jgi:cell division protein FtsA